MNELMEVVARPTFIDYLAPDNSEIRLLKDGSNGGLCECTLGPGAVTKPVSHKVVEEAWYVVSGNGKLWRQLKGKSTEINIKAGDSVLIPFGTEFQFTAGKKQPLVMLLATMPPWGAEIEAGGPNEGTGRWKLKAPPPEWRIQGNWWQLVARDDSTIQLALMRLARIGPLQYQIAGQSWVSSWEPRATFSSRDASFLPDERILRYSWTGGRNEDFYSGTGEILFTSDQDINSASGYYDMTLGSGVNAVVRMNAVYSRMAASENLEGLLNDASSFDRVVGEHFGSQND